MKHKHLLLFVLALLMMALPVSAQEMMDNTITVTGTGTAFGSPDTAFIEVGVDVENESVADALSQAGDAVTQIVNALEALGIERQDIQTTSVNIWRDERYDPQTGIPTGERVFRVSETLRIIVRDVQQVEEVISTGVENGVTNIFGLNFSITEDGDLLQSARENAVADARARAEHLASLLDVSVGDVVAIVEVNNGGFGPSRPFGGGGAFDVAENALPVVGGVLSVSVDVQNHIFDQSLIDK